VYDKENRRIFSAELRDSLGLGKGDPYLAGMQRVRFGLLRSHAATDRVLELGCGTGEYTLFAAGLAGMVVGVDVSEGMLEALAERADTQGVRNLHALQGDVADLALGDTSFDFVYSFSTLYYVPDVGRALAEIHRVLRGGGCAVFELGNRRSLNDRITRRATTGVRSYHLSPDGMRRAVEASGLRVIETRCFQLLPMYAGNLFGFRGGGRLTRLVSGEGRFERWFLSRGWGGRMLDERLSSIRRLRNLAFRHLYVCRKDP